MAVEISKRQQAGIQVVALSGRVSGAEVPRLTEQLVELKDQARPEAPQRVVLDATALDNLPSAVVGALLEAIRALEGADGRRVLAAPNAAIKVVLERLGVSDLVTSFKSLDEAIKALAATNGATGQ
jgi:anti-sigma B factor antagonist